MHTKSPFHSMCTFKVMAKLKDIKGKAFRLDHHKAALFILIYWASPEVFAPAPPPYFSCLLVYSALVVLLRDVL